ncbi:MAG: hypothetical protein Q8Q88_09460 [Phenylobacterium sp.]|uniref:hypothetical protein n=1 Tax=Phenylobacterium sp. TaxID=1871053 RepID=UPI0027347599|nr:hypothetical protein [Phenylobacterium sp.]MDP3747261.1 hypothetical protein [Phenylobacterium sp.]
MTAITRGNSNMLLAIALAALLAAAGPPPTPATGAAPGQPELKPGERVVKMVCRNEQRPASRMVKRRCMSVEDWKQQEKDAQAALKDMQDRREMNPPCQSSGRTC